MSILERTIKISLATILSIFLARSLRLEYASSAGIIAILSVLETRKSSLKMALHRLQSVLLAISIAIICFILIGHNLFALGIYLVFYVALAYHWKIAAGVAPSTVLVTHILAEEIVSLSFIGNELALFSIGVTIALLFNIYTPSKDKEIQSFHNKVEGQLKAILYRFEEFLHQGNGINDARLINELDGLLTDALEIVYHDRHNHLFQQTNYQVHYFEMRQQQNAILRQMATNINLYHLESQGNHLLAHLFRETAEQLSQHNSGLELIDEIEEKLATFRKHDLPKTREEFETRAILFQLLQDLERFIQLKVDFYKNYSD